MKIKLPNALSPRPYQQEVFDKFFGEGYRYIILIWPRRHGKDRTSFNILIGEAMKRVGLYFYAYPNRAQAKTAIWEGIMPDGTRFLDHIPKELLKNVNNSELKITLTNGSIIRLVGMDYYDHFVGTNPCGIVFSEYSVGNPIAYSLMRPILRENGGFAIFPYTPRGHTHGYDLYNINKDNPKWFCSFKTVNDCVDENGNQFLTPEDIEEERRSGMSENMIKQEFYCDFEATLEGAIFTSQIARAYKENRIKNFPIDRTKRVYTFWDLGIRDATAVWFVQVDDEGFYRAIYYYEMAGKPMIEHIPAVKNIGENLGITFGNHYAPHDAVQRDKGTGLTQIQIARNLGFCFEEPIKKMRSKEDGIESARIRFDKVIFHETNCEFGINCLKSYVRKVPKDSKEYGKPDHNWASHGADAFTLFSFVDIIGMPRYSTIFTTKNVW